MRSWSPASLMKRSAMQSKPWPEQGRFPPCKGLVWETNGTLAENTGAPTEVKLIKKYMRHFPWPLCTLLSAGLMREISYSREGNATMPRRAGRFSACLFAGCAVNWTYRGAGRGAAVDTGARRGASGICIRWKRPHLHETRGSRHGLSGLEAPGLTAGNVEKNRRAVSRRRHGDARRGRKVKKGRQLRGPQASCWPPTWRRGGSLRIHLGRQTGRHGRGRPPHLQNPPPREGGQPGLGHHPEPLH